MNKYTYYLGQVHAMLKLGMEEMPPSGEGEEDKENPSLNSAEYEPQQEPGMEMGLPPSELPGMQEQMGSSADDFVQFVQNDDTTEIADPNQEELAEPGSVEEGNLQWSGRTSVEGGDAGNRMMEMGLPTSGAV